MTNRRKNSIDLIDLNYITRKNSIDSIDSRSYSTDDNTPRISSRSNSIEIKIDISNNFIDQVKSNKINIPKRRRQRDQELNISKSPPTIEELKDFLINYNKE